MPFDMARLSSTLPASLLSYLLLLASVRAATDPIAATWSDQTFGPDGPWPAVEVVIGNEQKIALYPGHEYQTFLLTSDYCTYNSSLPCYASQAGLYNKAQSSLDETGSASDIQYAPGPNFMAGLDVDGDDATSWVDYIDLQDSTSATIPNVSMALLGESFASYPDGSWYPLTVGCLGLGAPGTVNQSFSTTSGPAVNASLIPGYLSAHNQIASNSFGMHIGSASPKMAGSLYFGGYDQNRIVGEVLTLGGTGDISNELTLNDISIQVIDGSSPFDFGDSQTGLLAEGNSSLSSAGLKTRIDGCSPYLSLPSSTCEAITAHLPVTLNEDLGLYLWNTDDAKYSQIVNSASALNFTFIGSSNTDIVSIAVPFRHLNLTLDAPLVSSKTQYFPCYTGHSGQYTLGRAFLQDAFVAAQWGTKTWFLAQAPGPNIPSPDVVTFASGSKTVSASTNDWKESWSGSWKALTPAEASASATVAASSSTATSVADSSTTSGLSTGAQAGIGVGVGLAGLAGIAALAFFLLRRRRAAKASPATSSDGSTYPGPVNNVTPQHAYYEPVKNPTSPNMTEPTIYSPNQQQASMYNPSANGTYNPDGSYNPPQHGSGYQQGYVQQGYPQQQFAAELPGAMSAAPQEMPTTYQTHQNELPAQVGTPGQLPVEAPGSPVPSHHR
ncbi:hypothetical protein SUNI508_06880 [Seiridium unicorne]|uniref:Peptidase A1 domain-containing protein n=1 Tax=Seiridium unicorne TaxID=138068 RepID=A0ABR2UZA7_9PEZI